MKEDSKGQAAPCQLPALSFLARGKTCCCQRYYSASLAKRGAAHEAKPRVREPGSRKRSGPEAGAAAGPARSLFFRNCPDKWAPVFCCGSKFLIPMTSSLFKLRQLLHPLREAAQDAGGVAVEVAFADGRREAGFLRSVSRMRLQ